jgi:hypothetical protein
MGTEPRLRIMQLLLSAHPEGLVVGEIITELGLSASTLASFGKAETRGPGPLETGGNLPALQGEYGGAAGTADLSVRRMLH